MSAYAIPVSKQALSSQIEFHDNAITDSTGNIYITGKYKYNSTRTLNNNISIASTTTDCFVLLKIDSNGYVLWVKTLNGFSGFDPTLYISSTSVYMVCLINNDTQSFIQIMRVLYDGTQHFNKLINVTNGQSEWGTNRSLQLLSSYDISSNKLYCSFVYKSDSAITIDSFTLPATSTYTYQVLLKLYGESGEVQLGRVFQINTTIDTTNYMTIELNSPGIILNTLSVVNNGNIYVVGLYNSNSNYQLSSEITVNSSTKMFICIFNSDLNAQQLYSSSLNLQITPDNFIMNTTTHLYIPLLYMSDNSITFEQISLPATTNQATIGKGLLLKVSNDLSSITAVLINLSFVDCKVINNNLYLHAYDASIDNATFIITYTHKLLKYNTSLAKVAEQTIGINIYDYATIGTNKFDVHRMQQIDNSIYILGGIQPVIKKYDLDINILYTKEMPSYIKNIAGAITPDKTLHIIGNVQTSATQTLESRLQFSSTNNVIESCIIKYDEIKMIITAGITLGAYLFINVLGLNPYRDYGIPHTQNAIAFIVRAYRVNADGTVVSTLRSTTFTSATSSILHVPLGPGITKYTLSYYVNGIEVNPSEPLLYNNVPSYLATKHNGINTSTPANIYNSIANNISENTTKGDFRFSTSGDQRISQLLTRVSALNNYQSSGKDIHEDGVQTLKSITIADPNVWGVFSETTSISNPASQTVVSYKLTKVDSAGNQILSDVNNPATFDTIVATVPKPVNGIITINRVINNTTTPNVASININTNAKTTTFPGQVITLISTTSNTVTISYKGPFSENQFESGSIEDQTFNIVDENIPCLPTGTRVLTPNGYCTVETLNTDDLVITAAGKTVPIRAYSKYIAFTTEQTAPYFIPARTFGTSQKNAIQLSPLHAINIGHNLWEIPKYAAMRYPSIKQDEIGKEITYYHIETPNFFRDNLVIEGGVVVESFAGNQCKGLKSLYVFDKKRNAFTRASAPTTAKKHQANKSISYKV